MAKVKELTRRQRQAVRDVSDLDFQSPASYRHARNYI